jgi:hypothetical protein
MSATTKYIKLVFLKSKLQGEKALEILSLKL